MYFISWNEKNNNNKKNLSEHTGHSNKIKCGSQSFPVGGATQQQKHQLKNSVTLKSDLRILPPRY